MPHEKLDPEVMETLKQIKTKNEDRAKAARSLEVIAQVRRELGEPDVELENFIQKTKLNVSRAEGVLKKRGV